MEDGLPAEDLFGDLDPASAITPELFAGLLQNVRTRAGRTYRQITEYAHRREGYLSAATLSPIFNGHRLPGADQLKLILGACGFTAGMTVPWIAALARLRDRQPVSRELEPSGRPRPDAESARAEGASWKCRLPGGDRVFRGRDALLAGFGTPGLRWLSGTPGAGTSELAIQWANRAAPGYDRVLYYDLKGLTPGRRRSTRDAATTLLEALGEPLTSGLSEDETLYAQLLAALARTRCLLLLDNVRQEQDVAPLAGTHGAAAVVVASRRRNQGLTTDAVHVPPLARGDSTALLAAFAPGAGQSALARIAELCDDLPLALRIVARALSNRPDKVPAILRALEDENTRLDRLSGPDRAVRLAILVSYHDLAPEVRKAARSLAVSFGSVSSGEEMAYGWDETDWETTLALHEVVDASLGECEPTGDATLQFSLRPLIRLVLAERSALEDDPAAVTGFRRRSARYLADRLSEVLRSSPAADLDPRIEPARARTALDAAVLGGWWDVAADLARDLATIHTTTRDLRALAEVTEALVTSRLETGRPDLAVQAAVDLARTLRSSPTYRQPALEWARRAVGLAREHRRPRLEIEALMTTSAIDLMLDRIDEGLTAARETLPLIDRTLSPGDSVNPLLNLGRLMVQANRPEEALPHFVRAAALADTYGDDLGRADAQLDLAANRVRLGDKAEADRGFARAITCYLAAGVPANAAVAQENRAYLALEPAAQLAAWTAAVTHWRAAPEHPARHATALVHQAALLYSAGNPGPAAAALDEAARCPLETASPLGYEIRVRQAALAREQGRSTVLPAARPAAHLVDRAYHALKTGTGDEHLPALLAHPPLHPAADFDKWLFDAPRHIDHPEDQDEPGFDALR